jgi:hypothetical protein
VSTGSIEVAPPDDDGEVGDDPSPHADASVASVAHEAIWHAPAQNRRRDTNPYVSDTS